MQRFELVAMGTDTREELKKTQEDSRTEGAVPFPLLSDSKLEAFKAYHCVDFENQPMHGVFLIDAQGRLRSQRISDKPFTDTALVLKEAKELKHRSGGALARISSLLTTRRKLEV